MNKYFDIKDKIYDVTEKYPETIDVFVSSGFDQFENEKMRKMMGKTISMKMACKSKKINVEVFEKRLVESIKQNRISEDKSLIYIKENKAADIKIEGILPCPVKLPLMESFEKWLETQDFQFTLDYQLKVASGGVDWIKDKIKDLEDEKELADIFISAGFDLFFDNKLIGKYKEAGVFEDFTPSQINKDFDNEYINLKDPDEKYGMIGVVPAVFLVNKEEIGDREYPKTWEDLFKEEFAGEVSLPVGDFDLFNAILLNIHKKYGEDGLRKLGRSFMGNMHPSEMVKSYRKKEKPTITIMPYFFTKMITGKGPMVPIWPEDGAIISPIFLLSKKDKKEKLKPIVDFFSSKEVGEILSNNGRFPSINIEVDNKLGSHQKFMWLGWDYINKQDIAPLIEKCEKTFNKSI